MTTFRFPAEGAFAAVAVASIGFLPAPPAWADTKAAMPSEEPAAIVADDGTGKRDGKPMDGSRIPASALKPVPYVTDDMLRGIVREAFGAQVVITANRGRERDGFTAAQRKILDERFEKGAIPVCLHDDGLKHQPTSIGPFGLSGLLQLPMVLVASVRGKCKF